MGSNKSLNLVVKDFLLDKKSIERHSFEEHDQIDTNFNLDLINKIDNNKEINAVFRAFLSVKYLKLTGEDESKLLIEIEIEMQLATYITNIDLVDLKNPSAEHIDIGINAIYPIARSLLISDLAYLKKDYSDIPYSM